MAYLHDDELREGIGLLFIEAGTRRDAISAEAWLAARSERELRLMFQPARSPKLRSKKHIRSITNERWRAALRELRLLLAKDRERRRYHEVIKADAVKYERKLAVSRDACKRYRAKKRLDSTATKLHRVPAEMKTRIVALSEAGLIQREIASIVGVSVPTVCRALKAYRALAQAAE